MYPHDRCRYRTTARNAVLEPPTPVCRQHVQQHPHGDRSSGSGQKTRTISIPDPYNLYFTPDGSLAIDVAERLGTLFFFDPRTWRPRGSVTIPWSGADHLDFSRSGRYLILSTEFAGEVVKVDVAGRRVVGSVHVGGVRSTSRPRRTAPSSM